MGRLCCCSGITGRSRQPRKGDGLVKRKSLVLHFHFHSGSLANFAQLHPIGNAVV